MSPSILLLAIEFTLQTVTAILLPRRLASTAVGKALFFTFFPESMLGIIMPIDCIGTEGSLFKSVQHLRYESSVDSGCDSKRRVRMLCEAKLFQG